MAKSKSPVTSTPAPAPPKGPMFHEGIPVEAVLPNDLVQYFGEFGNRIGVVVKTKKRVKGFVTVRPNGKKGVERVALGAVSKAWRDMYVEQETFDAD